MTDPAISQDDIEAVDPEWLAEMLTLAARGEQPPARADSTLIQPNRSQRRHLY